LGPRLENIAHNTGMAIPPEYWDKKRLCIKENLPSKYFPPKFPAVAKLNDELDRQQRLACDLIKLAKNQGIAEWMLMSKKSFPPI